MPRTSQPNTSRTPKPWVWLTGLAVTVGLLWWALHDVDLGQVIEHLRATRLLLLLVAVAIATATFPLRAIRWRALLTTDRSTPPLGALWHAVAIGFMANNLLPARAGEVARAYLGARFTELRFSTTLASLALERALDLGVIVALTAVALVGPGLTDVTVAGTPLAPLLQKLAAASVGAVVVALVLALFPQRTNRLVHAGAKRLLSKKWADRVENTVEGLLDGFAALRNPERAARVMGWTAVLWLVNAASFWFAIVAFNIAAPLTSGLLVQGFTAIGVALPSSPGYVGPFEAAIRAALSLYNVNPDLAVAYAIGYHVTTFIPITALGLWSLRRAHLRFADLSRVRETAEGA